MVRDFIVVYGNIMNASILNYITLDYKGDPKKNMLNKYKE
jgi:hypothetical protein